jgi:hypothetical protein
VRMSRIHTTLALALAAPCLSTPLPLRLTSLARPSLAHALGSARSSPPRRLHLCTPSPPLRRGADRRLILPRPVHLLASSRSFARHTLCCKLSTHRQRCECATSACTRRPCGELYLGSRAERTASAWLETTSLASRLARAALASRTSLPSSPRGSSRSATHPHLAAALGCP